MKKKLILGVVCLGILGGLALPLSNLAVGLPKNNSLSGFESEDASLAEAAHILAAKCVNCHTDEYTLPFYAKLPVAKGIIEMDIHEGKRHLDYKVAFAEATDGPLSEVVLAKTERSVEDGSMPPMRYLALHWNGALSSGEKATLLDWVKASRAKHFATGLAAAEFANERIQPCPLEHGQDPAKVALGDKLYHDERLSTDDTLACAGCHGLDKGGTDQRKFSEGVGQQVGDINAPTTFNAGFQFKQFWDGRAADLEEQADGPVNNPIEMGSNWDEAIPKLEADAELTAAFKKVYPEGYSKESITSAIAIFERTLITPNSKADKYLMGDKEALDADEKAGFALFKEYRCDTCHVGKAIGGQSFEIMGLKADYFGDRGGVHKPDYGRFNVTGNEADRFRLKVPTLRNIALTGPYFHDASTDDLGEAVAIMAKYESGRDMPQGDQEKVVAFLNALTGEYNGKLLE